MHSTSLSTEALGYLVLSTKMLKILFYGGHLTITVVAEVEVYTSSYIHLAANYDINCFGINFEVNIMCLFALYTVV